MNVLVVGHGVMGKNHVRVLEEMGHRVASLDPIPSSGANYLWLTDELIEFADAVCVATPIADLSRVASLWMGRGRDVLVEKPGALSLNDLLALQDEAGRLDVRFAVGYTERFNPGVQALADNLGMVGRVRHIRARRLGLCADRGGDPALDLATHDLDVLEALGFELRFQHASRGDHHLCALLAAEHVSPLVVPGSATVSIEASHLHPNKVRDLEVVGDGGVLQLDYQRQALDYVAPDGKCAELVVDRAEPLRREWEAFFNGDGSMGTAALTIAEQIVYSVAVDEPLREVG